MVLYRARNEADLVHLDELKELATRLGGQVKTLVGPTATLGVHDPFSAPVLTAVVPDVGTHVAVVRGPESLVHAARRGLVAAGVPRASIHYERAWW